jgi:hypothetical protein
VSRHTGKVTDHPALCLQPLLFDSDFLTRTSRSPAPNLNSQFLRDRFAAHDQGQSTPKPTFRFLPRSNRVSFQTSHSVFNNGTFALGLPCSSHMYHTSRRRRFAIFRGNTIISTTVISNNSHLACHIRTWHHGIIRYGTPEPSMGPPRTI